MTVFVLGFVCVCWSLSSRSATKVRREGTVLASAEPRWRVLASGGREMSQLPESRRRRRGSERKEEEEEEKACKRPGKGARIRRPSWTGKPAIVNREKERNPCDGQQPARRPTARITL